MQLILWISHGMFTKQTKLFLGQTQPIKLGSLIFPIANSKIVYTCLRNSFLARCRLCSEGNMISRIYLPNETNFCLKFCPEFVDIDQVHFVASKLMVGEGWPSVPPGSAPGELILKPFKRKCKC